MAAASPKTPKQTGPPLVNVVIKNLSEEDDEEGSNVVKVKLKKNDDITAIKERIDLEFGIPVHEMLLLFRGKHIAWRRMTTKEEAYQPLNTPDLEDIVEEAGEDGLRMSVIHKPYRLVKFMKQEKFEAEDYNKKYKSGATLLHRAVRLCELSVVEELLWKEEFEVCDERDRYGQTALHTACTAWQREALEILLKHPDRFTNVIAKDSEGRNALHYIACWGDQEACKNLLADSRFLLKDIKAEDKRGFTPLQLCTDMGHREVAAAIRKELTRPEDEEDQEEDEDWEEAQRRQEEEKAKSLEMEKKVAFEGEEEEKAEEEEEQEEEEEEEGFL